MTWDQLLKLRFLNAWPNHCWLNYSCPGRATFTIEANSDLYYSPGYPFHQQIPDNILWILWYLWFRGIDLSQNPIPFAYIVRPIIRWGDDPEKGVRYNVSCTSCVNSADTPEICDAQFECLRRGFFKYPRGNYWLFFCNSNTFAGALARSCCENNPNDCLPGPIPQAWGWRDVPCAQVPHFPIGAKWTWELFQWLFGFEDPMPPGNPFWSNFK